MAWVRLHDDAMSHPKIVGLSDKAFRLWVWGLSYCQRHLTDGLVNAEAIPARIRRAAEDLIAMRLWERSGRDFLVHDYLDWNDSKATVTKKRSEAKERMSNARQRSSRELLRGVGEEEAFTEKGSGEKPAEDLTRRAGQLLQILYPAWYGKYRNGAKLRLLGNSLEFQDAVSLVRLWDDDRLEKLARIVLTTDEPFIANTDRGFKIFALKASWADDRLRQLEAKSA